MYFGVFNKEHGCIRIAFLTSLGLDGSVGDNNDWPLELAFKVLNHLWSNLLEESEGSEWDSDKDVLGGLSVSLLKFDFFGRVEVDKLQVLLDVNCYLLPSFSLCPLAPVAFALSDPARSTRWILDSVS